MRARFETVKRLEAAPRRSSLKKVTLSNFTKFRRKQLRQSFFIDKVEDWKPATLSITASRTGIFLWILQNFQQHIFWRTPTDGCLKNKQLKVFIHSLAKLLYAWSQARQWRIGAVKSVIKFLTKFAPGNDFLLETTLHLKYIVMCLNVVFLYKNIYNTVSIYDSTEFEKWRPIRAGVVGVGGVLAWMTC